MLGAIAEFERALIKERTLAGLAEARRKGRTGGRPRLLAPKDIAAARALIGASLFKIFQAYDFVAGRLDPGQNM